MRPYTTEDIEDLLSDVREQPTRQEQRLHMMELYPHLPERYWNRHLGYLLSLSADQVIRVIGYPDPTGEHATNLAMRQAA